MTSRVLQGEWWVPGLAHTTCIARQSNAPTFACRASRFRGMLGIRHNLEDVGESSTGKSRPGVPLQE
jgi:hypothetical protein